MAMAMAVIPSTLVRSLRQYAVKEENADRRGGSDDTSSVTHGVLIGSARDNDTDAPSIALWGVTRQLAECDELVTYLPGGIAPIGVFSVWHRGASSHQEKATTAADTDDEEAVAALQIAREALEAAARSNATVMPTAMLSLVYSHDMNCLHLFRNVNGQSDPMTVPLTILETRHASDFLAATRNVLLRSAVDLTIPASSSVAAYVEAYRDQLDDQTSSRIAFRFPENAARLVDGLGMELASLVTEDGNPEPNLRELVKFPEPLEQASSKSKTKSKQKKSKNGGVTDGWETTSTVKVTSNHPLAMIPGFEKHDEDVSPRYLKTLEYGDIACVEVLTSLAPPRSIENKDEAAAAPNLLLPSNQSKAAKPTRIHVDALAVLSQDATVAQVVKELRTQLSLQLASLEMHSVAGFTDVESSHFALLGAAFPITLPVTVPPSSAAAGTVAIPTEALGDLFLQPPYQPRFVVPRCSLTHQDTCLRRADVLINVHEGIPASGIQGGEQFLVDGFYGYYHYMQQGMDDKGWGCAYRSLQTLASWLDLNHYITSEEKTSSTATTNVASSPIPSHAEIQQTLVAIGDKPTSFVNSREWIGSMEVGFVLDERFGVTFRSLSVPSGPRLVEQAQELKHHFTTQGTPVMMGGNNLAFTLLGIDYNATTGDCAFLILDPHYVGVDDLHTIQTKTMALEGYKAVPCGWRKASTFAKNSFYNLCLPQRPHLVV